MSQGQVSPKNYETIDKTQKILNLQQQLLNVRKQMSKKQSQWQKQRSNLLSKNQVANIQIIQLKQRISNLAKINQTLSNAMTSQSQSFMPQKLQTKIKRPKPLKLGDDSNDIYADSQYDNKQLSKYQQQVKRLNKIIQQNDFQINNLNKIGNQLRTKLEERNNVVSNLQQTCYNLKRKIQKKEQEILKLHKQIQQVQDNLQENNQYIDDTRRKSAQYTKRIMNPQEFQQPAELVRKYSKNSSYLIMKPTPDHSGFDPEASYYNQINFSEIQDQNQNEEQQLLCQKCNGVYNIIEFQQHVNLYCPKVKQNNARYLFQKKKQIQQKLQRIKLQQQKQNARSRYYKNQQQRYESDNYLTNRQKINQIRQIAKDLGSKRQKKKNQYDDFSIKNKNYYY